MSELLPRETKVEYTKTKSSWAVVYIVSVLCGVISGAAVIYTSQINELANNYSIALTVMATIAGYAAGQATMTDTKLHLVDRKMLRIAYSIAFVITIYMTLQPENNFNWPSVFATYFVIVITFLFINIGASDVRSMAIVVPFTSAINGDLGIIILIGILLFILVIQSALKYRAKKEVPLPVAYTLIWPYVVAFIAMPFFI